MSVQPLDILFKGGFRLVVYRLWQYDDVIIWIALYDLESKFLMASPDITKVTSSK